MRALIASLMLLAACNSDGLSSVEDAAAPPIDLPAFDSPPRDFAAPLDFSSLADLCTGSQTDPENCGACGHRCCAGDVCLSGTCTGDCPSGETLCALPVDAGSCYGHTCVDTQSDNMNCGGCNMPCPPGATCISGACVDPK